MTGTTALTAPAAPGAVCDVAIVGAGPAGLILAASLVQAGFSVTLLERNSEEVLADPPSDGREIALTHPSAALLRRVGSWQHLAAHEVGTIRAAKVHDGPLGQHRPLALDALGSGVAHLGWIVPNFALRRSAWQRVQALRGERLDVLCNVSGVRTRLAADAACVEYIRGGAAHTLRPSLVVAADGRFSALRTQWGIGASLQDFGRTVIVCRLRHEKPHGEVAHECFGYRRTLAILPLPADPADGRPRCSAVVTAHAPHAQALLEMPAPEFARLVQEQFAHRLGAMELVGERHACPLVAVYAHRFADARRVLLGDAAVGMHPVTAHGYNLGLGGVQTLTRVLARARARGLDIGSGQVLARHERECRQQAWPIYHGTNAIVGLYTDARAPARLLRRGVLAASMHLPPLKSAIVRQLTGH